MKRLLLLEYYKNLNYKPFQIFSILYFLVLIALLFIGLVDMEPVKGLKINLKQQGIYNFPEIWNFTTWIVALLKIFLGLILVFSICQEFTNRMFKQNTIDGLSRKEFVFSKLLTIFIFTILSTIIVFGITLALGIAYSNTTESQQITQEIFFIGNYFVKLFTFFSFLMFLSILLRKSIFVFLFFFMYWIGESILSGIESFLRIKNITAGPDQIKALTEEVLLTNLLPLNSMSSLISNPFSRLTIAKQMGFNYNFSYPTESLIACIIWCVIFVSGSYFILKKKDW